MQRFFFLIALSLYSLSLFAQYDLTEEQEKEYNRQKITIDIKSGTAGYFNNYNSFFTSDYQIWQAYIGFSIIDEFTFFSVTGYEFEAKQAKQFDDSRKTCLISGVLISAVGYGLLFSSIIPITTTVQFDDPNYNTKKTDLNNQFNLLFWSGLAIGVIGAFPLGIAISDYSHNWAPANKAKEIADEFNIKLLSVIKNASAAVQP